MKRLLLPVLLCPVLLCSFPAHAAPSKQTTLNKTMDWINFNWYKPLNAWHGTRVTTACLTLSPEGQLTSLAICKSSGNAAWDASLLKAIRKSMPLPIPANQLDDFRNLQLTFTYNQ